MVSFTFLLGLLSSITMSIRHS